VQRQEKKKLVFHSFMCEKCRS